MGGWAQAEQEVREAATERPGAEAPALSCRPGVRLRAGRDGAQRWCGALSGICTHAPGPPAWDGGALSPGAVVHLAQEATGQGWALAPRGLRGVHPSVLRSMAPHTLASPAHPPGLSGPGASPQVGARAEARVGPWGPGVVPLGCTQTPAGDKGATPAALP